MNITDKPKTNLVTGSEKRPLLSKSEFDLLRVHIQQISGITLDDSKMALMESRLSPLLAKYGCLNYTDLYVKSQNISEINVDICNAISTNETSFFRDPDIFRMIADKLIPMFLNKSNSLHIWSAAASTGQEAYSLSMLLREQILNIDKYDIRIVGTDISAEAIAYASYGAYTNFELARGVDEKRLATHFDPHDRGYRIKDENRYHVHFKQFNLLTDAPFDMQYDIILCRNVAIYFDKETKKRLFEKMASCLKPRGCLIIGSTETLWQVTNVYHRRDADGIVYYSIDETDD